MDITFNSGLACSLCDVSFSGLNCLVQELKAGKTANKVMHPNLPAFSKKPPGVGVAQQRHTLEQPPLTLSE